VNELALPAGVAGADTRLVHDLAHHAGVTGGVTRAPPPRARGRSTKDRVSGCVTRGPTPGAPSAPQGRR
jgi:hypothetical protein